MPSPREHQARQIVKLLLIGDAKTGKTTSLHSLVKAGYWMGLLDFDNLTDPFVNRVMKYGDLADNVDIVPLRDKYTSGSQGPVIEGIPQAWTRAVKMFDRWKYIHNGEEVDYGVPANWGPDRILVIDSLTRMCDAAFNFHEAIIPKGRSTGEADGRAIYGNAQRAVGKLLAMLTSDSFNTNVIVIGHGSYQRGDDGKTRIFPEGVGTQLSPRIPTWFPNYIKYDRKDGKRTIQLDSDTMISLANGNSDVLKGTLDIDDGLAKFFGALRNAPKSPATKPQTSPTLKRVI